MLPTYCFMQEEIQRNFLLLTLQPALKKHKNTGLVGTALVLI